MSNEAERRTGGNRARVEIDVDLSSYGNYYLSKLANLSPGGAFIRTFSVYPIGTELTLRFRLPNDTQAIEAEGEVAWNYTQPGDTDANATGVGVMFTKLKPEDRERIESFVKKEISPT